jgi:putative methionine-R-sulfoxide reductase with GAF domain
MSAANLVVHTPRDYSRILTPRAGSREDRMQALVDAFWHALSPQRVSWIGFYLGPGERFDDGRTVGPDEMLLGPCRNKPACSPLGLHGVCGQGWRQARSIIVRDVAVMGPNYVACDPHDRSEVLVPLLDAAGRCSGVLDVDSYDLDAFDERDAAEFARILIAGGLLSADAPKHHLIPLIF